VTEQETQPFRPFPTRDPLTDRLLASPIADWVRSEDPLFSPFVWLIAVLLAAAAGIGIGAATAPSVGSAPGHAATPMRTVSSLPVTAVTSYDPSGGSGFTRTNVAGHPAWASERYTSPTFGNLKPGIGLVFDLGQPRPLSRVVVPVYTPGIVVQLIGSNTPATARTASASAPVTASGASVTLVSNVRAPFRYWLVWVSRLASTSGGFAAVIGTPVAVG
jgi:putative peptidoglycan lipid II flippase